MLKRIKKIKPLIKLFKKHDLEPILVGGMVRDNFLGKESKDIDIEVYNSEGYDSLCEILEPFKPITAGKSFGVIKIKIKGLELDISLPRTESSSGEGHKDFEVQVSEKLTYPEAFKRRDFTMNAIGVNLITNELIDEFNGILDLSNKIIKHVDCVTFMEDPLRVFRAVQFASRFEFSIHPSTFVLMKTMVNENQLDSLSKERIFEEFNKLLLKSERPGIGIELMKELGILEKYFPEIFNLIGVEQEKKWHPEGDVYTHTLLSLNKMATIKNLQPEKKLVHMYAILCHDFGKTTCTKVEEDGRITSSGHESAGVEPARMFMRRLTREKELVSQICVLVEHHLKPSLLFSGGAKINAIKRLNHKLLAVNLNLIDLALVNKADSLGRTTPAALKNKVPQFDWLIKKTKNVSMVEPEPALVTGKDLIEEGLTPGKEFKSILQACYNYQIEHSITDKDKVMEFFRTF